MGYGWGIPKDIRAGRFGSAGWSACGYFVEDKTSAPGVAPALGGGAHLRLGKPFPKAVEGLRDQGSTQ